ncbi:Lin0368 family putative glycerol transporter subunit [Clostridium chromiireducens]|uniref:Uncharacterized protein n=1 Tax=Clostridium chromiireducens TaxID=225345 RepID=A0A1V4J1C7_9CLOT|nr:hypothetical protein [Clostridium chromiireducens]OPJ65457.1 hypothetical protein CLCHR_08470 [Clostridium chromiireducens]
MRFLRNTFGYFLAATVINGLWGIFLDEFGLFGTYGAAFFLTGSMWCVNHYIGLIKHDNDSAFVDMGLGVAIGLIAKNYMVNGSESLINSVPTLLYVVIGAALGGYMAVLMEKHIMEKGTIEIKPKKESLESVNIELVDGKLEV